MNETLVKVSDLAGMTCAHCGAVTSEDHFCRKCHRILPVSPTTDFFDFFGLERKLRIDEADLEKKFYRLSRQFHPDYFMNAGELERQASIQRSSMLNDAYRILSDHVSRTQYLLSLEGYKEAERKAPPDLLEEVFELNVEIEQLRAAKKIGDEDETLDARRSLESALAKLKQRLAQIDAVMVSAFGEWDHLADAGADKEARTPILDRMNELLSHRKYISNLVRDISEEL